MDFSKYLFRAHMVGKIINVPKPLSESQQETLTTYIDRENGIGRALTDNQKNVLIDIKYRLNKSKEYSLTDSQRRILAELVFALKYGRKKEINSEKLTKGLEVEKDSRDLISRVTGLFLTSNPERKNNDWVTGQIDIKPNEVIADIKSSWSWETFSKHLEETASEIYLRQGDSYMDLWDRKEFLLIHTLVDTPHRLIDKNIRSLDYSNNVLNVEGEVREENIDEVKGLICNHIFTRQGLEAYCIQSPVSRIEWFDDFKEIPEEERVHMIPHSFDPIRIEQRNECIRLAREYMNTVNPMNNFKKELLY